MSGTVQQGVTIKGIPRLVVTICVMLATLMQALDSTIANVALPYMQGSLSASYDQVTWVLTSYVAAAAVMTAPAGWISDRFGSKNVLLACLIGFTVASMLCGIATSLPQMVLYRLIQGAFGAALGPIAQATMMDMYTAEQRGTVMSLWGMGIMVGPIIGPTLGGYLTFYYSWRYVFFVNLPFGVAAILGLMFLMPRGLGQKRSFDWTGFLVLAVALCALQITLDRGEELDWFSSSTIVIAAIVTVLGFYLFIVHIFTAKNPFIPRAAFGDRNFNAGMIAMFSVGISLLASSALLSPYLENLANYPVDTAGLVMAPRGVGTMVALLLAGRLMNRVDPRLVMFFGISLILISTYMMEGWTPIVAQKYIMFTVSLQGIGIGFMFLPLQVLSFVTLAPKLRSQGTALIGLMRNVGSAIGISMASALLDRQTHYEHAVLSQFITPFSRALQAGGQATGMLAPGTAAGAATLDTMVNTQAQIIAYIDDYKFLLLTSVPSMIAILFMRRPAATKAIPNAADTVMD